MSGCGDDRVSLDEGGEAGIFGGIPVSLLDAVDMVRRRFVRVGEVEKSDLLVCRSREAGRCCQDRVPVLLRRLGDAGLGDVSRLLVASTVEPLRLALGLGNSSPRSEAGLEGVMCSGVRGVGSSCCGGSMARWPSADMLIRAGSNNGGESLVGESERARSIFRPHRDIISLSSGSGGNLSTAV